MAKPVRFKHSPTTNAVTVTFADGSKKIVTEDEAKCMHKDGETLPKDILEAQEKLKAKEAEEAEEAKPKKKAKKE